MHRSADGQSELTGRDYETTMYRDLEYPTLGEE